MKGALLLAVCLAGCMTGGAPEDVIDARRACTALEGLTFTTATGSVAFVADDAEYSAYETTQADGATSSGLVQCEVRGAVTLLYVDAADVPSGRIDSHGVRWFGAALTAQR